MTQQIDTNWYYPEKGEYPVAFGEYKQKVYPQIPCLVLYKGRHCVRYWNCLEEYWDNEECDDFFCRKDEVEKWMYIDALEKKSVSANKGEDVEKAKGGVLDDETFEHILAKAAKVYAEGEYSRKNPATLPDRCRGCYAPIEYAFRAGARWMKENNGIQ